MQIEQFESKELSHYSYAVLSENKIVLIDPSRNIKPYLDYAERFQATITGVIETLPHADFVSDTWSYIGQPVLSFIVPLWWEPPILIRHLMTGMS